LAAAAGDRAEGDVVVRPALEIELLGRYVCRRIQVGGRQHGHDLIPAFEPGAAEIHLLPHEPRLRELHRGDEAQEFVDRQVRSAACPQAS
jgi:hypothetical protein